MSRLGLTDPEREARLLSRIIETISAGLDLGEIVQGVAALITETTETDICFVHLLDDTGRRLVLRGATPPFDELSGQIELDLGEGVAGWVAAHGRPVVIDDDKLADPRYKYIPELRGEDFTSMCSVPIAARPGHLVGVLNVHTRVHRVFTYADVELLHSVGGLIAGTIENARLHGLLAEREEAMERFAERVVLAQEAERRRLAGEIHDGISQRIVSLSYHLSAALDALAPETPPPGGGRTVTDLRVAAEQIGRARALADDALRETRSAIEGLRPPVLDDLGLPASLASLARSFPSLAVEADLVPLRLPGHVETAIYRVAQEALSNVAKHSGAGSALISLAVRSGNVELEIEDDGVGFDPSRLAERPAPTGYGLGGMRERAELLGGRLEVHSRRGAGTLLRVVIPVRDLA
ncbi:GAF domain-containing sensor histidine kinase [Planomonospora sp. ID67723]|uniref:GAF domain-containing sensor histidine kinase n=1 Tax=Planomonospora sp. ID67723 TaxID=2738134 RepID=UPI0018C3D10B|nr:GAF domain-containing sensor histidine kinase [Planomonospora sp. ID67723]MBG0832438.1 GAF domain-containing sensor histidine kinase [Planomonospora sp. ID67723]